MNTTQSFYINIIRTAVELFLAANFGKSVGPVVVTPSHISAEGFAMGYAANEDLAVVEAVQKIASLLAEESRLERELAEVKAQIAFLWDREVAY